MHRFGLTRRSAAGCALILVSACGGRAGEDGSKSPVVAVVNDRPVTIAQLNQAVQAADPVAPVAPAQAVESLVNEELLVQGAEKQHIERDPVVAQAIESSRRQILAHAFAERNLYPKQGISETQAEEFYRANPILFEDRKRFRVKNYTFEGMELNGQLTAELDAVHSDADLRELLDKHDIKYTVQLDTLSADQLPLDKLTEFEHAAVGDVMTAHQASGNALLIMITNIQNDDAMSFARAKPYIEAYLSNSRNREAVGVYLGQVKATAKIKYPSDVKPDGHEVVDHGQGFSAVAKTNGSE